MIQEYRKRPLILLSMKERAIECLGDFVTQVIFEQS